MPTARLPQYAVLIIPASPQTLFNHFYESRHYLAPVTKGKVCRSTAVSAPIYQLGTSKKRFFHAKNRGTGTWLELSDK